MGHQSNVQPNAGAPPAVRQARLRPDYAHLYPGVAVGVWLTAAEISAQVLFVRYTQEGPAGLVRRPLEEVHFEFRGGWERVEVDALRTRANDSEFKGPVRA